FRRVLFRSRDAWRSSRNNGPIAWLLSAIMAAAAAWWLTRPGRRQIIERGLRPASWAIAGGMAFGLALVAGAFLGVVLASAWYTIGPLHAFPSMYNSLLTGNAVLWAVVGTVGVATLRGALLGRI